MDFLRRPMNLCIRGVGSIAGYPEATCWDDGEAKRLLQEHSREKDRRFGSGDHG
jgi:hypothetical protein